MEKLMRTMLRDFGLLIAIGLIIPHFILIQPGMLLSLLVILYISIENTRILSASGVTLRSKIYLMALLTLVDLIYICILKIADLHVLDLIRLLIHAFLLLGWVSLFWQKVDAVRGKRK